MEGIITSPHNLYSIGMSFLLLSDISIDNNYRLKEYVKGHVHVYVSECYAYIYATLQRFKDCQSKFPVTVQCWL